MKVLIFNPPTKFTKNVARDLVYGCWCKGKRIAAAEFPPTTLLMITTILSKEQGVDVVLFDSQTKDYTYNDSINFVIKQKPDIIIIPTSTMSYEEDAETLRKIKKSINCVTLVFGSHVTFMPNESLGKKGVDYLVMREPEYIIRDFVRTYYDKKNINSVRGLAFRHQGRIIINQQYPFIKNLDNLPIIDRYQIKDFTYFNPLVKRLPWTTVITSRGCAGKCTFCTSPSFYGEKLRFMTAERVVDELKYVISMGYKEVFFRDETFTADKKRLKDICNLIIKEELDITWISNARVDNLNEELLVLMKKAGCHTIKIGVESGSQEILNNIKKGIKISATENIFKLAIKIGINTHAHLMIGSPGETWDTVSETIKFLKRIKPTTITAGAFTPFPGTKIFDELRKKNPSIGDGTNCNLSNIHTKGFFSKDVCKLSDEEVGKAVKKVYRKFYMRPTYIISRILSIRSFTDIRRLLFAGITVLDFSLLGE